ncbi:hypothetical protein FRB95_011373 [Tulasnella sp. JGI-2019a]|nr:hypothetical protein FRB95_011373 [Tulasnella sp. JGI-2019a]
MAVLQALKFIAIPPRTAHTSTIVFLHGLGDSGAEWRPLTETLASTFPGTKWILPHARAIPVTFNHGMSMPAWFDIKELPSDVDKDVDVQGIWASAREINAIITSEIGGGIPENKIILGGFSQGCGMTLITGLTTEIKLAGLVCLSGRLLYDTIKESMTSESRNLPIFWGHGTADPVVAFSRGQDALHRPRGN